MSLRINLDPRSPARAWNAADPSGTSDFAHNATVYTDRAEEVTFFYLPVCGRVWQYHAFDLLAVECGSGELEFNEDGELMRVTQLVPLRLTMTTGELAEPIALDYGPLAPSAGQSSSTSNDPNSMVYLLEQDGYEAGAGPDCR